MASPLLARSLDVPLGPRRSRVALLLIDVVNPLDFPGGDDLLRAALPMARRIAALKQRARAAGVPCVYVNDNFDCWHLGFHELVERIRGSGAPSITQFFIDRPIFA